ncbi:unnamed protein product [Cercopithifilaria johnstoni]|uniref:C6 domain-containing protein n=1 Tax=Cercopithifilaria johnstoni TaxID=2874296 RepID=A0A8J2Q700_9BILA|nr:unnamed protein product [Cercopithifilaria johnstoni]
MNAKIILIFSGIGVINLHACEPSASYTTCRNCDPFDTNIRRTDYPNTFVEKITVSYGVNADGCKFATLQCLSSAAKDILMEWYDPSGSSLGTTGAVKHTQKVIGLITCNQNSEWTFTENGKTEVVQSATCEYIQ